MKHLIRVFLFNFFALWVMREICPGLHIAGGLQMMLVAGGVLSILMIIVKPMLKILFIPFNFLTFGIAGLFINVVVFYLLTLLLPEVTISQFELSGWSTLGFVIPSVHVSYLAALIFVSLGVTILSHLLHQVAEE